MKVYQLFDLEKMDEYNRSEVAAVKFFIKQVSAIFKKKYADADKSKANPAKYGKYNWNNVEVKLEHFSWIQKE